MAHLESVTVTISLEMDINGVPVQRLYEAPATSQMLDGHGGLRVVLHIDGKELAKAILPELAMLIRQKSGIRDDSRIR